MYIYIYDLFEKPRERDGPSCCLFRFPSRCFPVSAGAAGKRHRMKKDPKTRQRYPPILPSLGCPVGHWASARCRLPGIFRISSRNLPGFGDVRVLVAFGPSFVYFTKKYHVLASSESSAAGRRKAVDSTIQLDRQIELSRRIELKRHIYIYIYILYILYTYIYIYTY